MGIRLSAYTSVNKDKVPVLFTQAVGFGIVYAGQTVLDYGCGRWPEVARDYLISQGVDHVDSWDPNWFPDADYVPVEGYDVVCVSNVLNVIPAKLDRLIALKAAWEALKPGGVMLVTVYEADGSGASGPSKEGCWQERRKLNSYILDELSAYMGTVYPGGKLWKSMPKPHPGRKWFPPAGTRLTIVRPTGSAMPYTVVGRGANGTLEIRRCRLVFDGPHYYDTVADRIEPGDLGDPQTLLTWKRKGETWGEGGKARSHVVWGKWFHQPYLD